MNLLIIIHSLSSGGAERVTANLANYWAEKGWNITVVTLTNTVEDFYPLAPTVRRIALDIAGESSGLLAAVVNNLHRIYILRRLLQQQQPDIALAMMSTANILLALASIGLKDLIKIGSERTYPPSFSLGGKWERLRKFSYARLNAVVALTKESADWIKIYTKAQRVAVIANAVTWPLSEQPPQLALPSKPAGQCWLLAIGRLSSEKGFDLLISTFQRLTQDFPQWRLFILGEGSERKNLKAQIDMAGLDHHIHLAGRAGNIAQWYKAADLYVMSSRFEGFPNTLVEAMAYGLPVISFNCDTGPRDIIQHGINGLLVSPGDCQELEKALRQMMANSNLRQQFAAKSVKVQERLSMKRIAGLWEELFQELNACKLTGRK